MGQGKTGKGEKGRTHIERWGRDLEGVGREGEEWWGMHTWGGGGAEGGH